MGRKVNPQWLDTLKKSVIPAPDRTVRESRASRLTNDPEILFERRGAANAMTGSGYQRDPPVNESHLSQLSFRGFAEHRPSADTIT